MRITLFLGFLCLALLGCPSDDSADDDVADDDVADDDVTDDDVADDDVADDDAVDDDTGGDDDSAATDDDTGDDDVGDDDAGDDDAGDDDAGDDDTGDDDTGDDDTAFTSATVPGDYPTIQDAIDAVVDGDSVWVEAGTYVENLDFGGKAIHVLGIDGSLGGAVVTFVNGEGADSILEGFTLIHGNGHPTMGEDGTHDPCGGGIFVAGASPTLTHLTISANTAWDGGGMYVDAGASPSLTNVVIADNTALDDGGGMYVWASDVALTNVFVTGNVAQGEDGGGMIVKASSTATLANVAITGNSAPDDGGGIRLKNSDMALSNVTIAGNMAGDGGGLAVKSCTATLSGVVLAYNVASSQGGAVYEKAGGTALLSYCNAWDNLPNNYDGAGGMVDPTGTNGNVSVDPLLLDTSSPVAANWDLHLAAASPLVGQGDPSMLDPDGSISDMGAYGGPDAASWDLDHDGAFGWWLPGPYDAATSPGMDCDDLNAAVYPGNGC